MTFTPDAALARFAPTVHTGAEDADDGGGHGGQFDDDGHASRGLARLETIAEAVQDFARAAKAPNTLKPTASTGTISFTGAGCTGWNRCLPRRRRSRCT